MSNHVKPLSFLQILHQGHELQKRKLTLIYINKSTTQSKGAWVDRHANPTPTKYYPWAQGHLLEMGLHLRTFQHPREQIIIYTSNSPHRSFCSNTCESGSCLWQIIYCTFEQINGVSGWMEGHWIKSNQTCIYHISSHDLVCIMYLIICDLPLSHKKGNSIPSQTLTLNRHWIEYSIES